jgi:ADP-ribose pyrophosphatase
MKQKHFIDSHKLATRVFILILMAIVFLSGKKDFCVTQSQSESQSQAQPLHQQPWEVLAEANVFDASPWVSVTRQHVRLPNGVEITDFYHVAMPVYVMVFAITPDQQVVMVEQYRHGVRAPLIELPAGNIEGEVNVETALESANRELAEETGFTASEWLSLGYFSMDSNRNGGGFYAYLAKDAICENPPTPEETEIIHTHLIPVEEVRQRWLSGQINTVSSSAVIGLALAHLS